MNKIVLLLIFLGVTSSTFGWDATPRCLYQVETNFFEVRRVTEALDLYHVFQSQWDPIYTDLKINAQNVPKLVREHADKMHPNPFQYPVDPIRAKEVVMEVEFAVFRDTMLAHYFEDLNAIHGMFEYIRHQQEPKVDSCLGVKAQKKAEKPLKGVIFSPR